MARLRVLMVGVVLFVSTRSGVVRAINTISLPDNSSCTSTNSSIPCFEIINDGTSEDAYAIAGWTNTNSAGSGVVGHADGAGRGVVGYSTSYRGVEGSSQGGDGVVGIAHSAGYGLSGTSVFGIGAYGTSTSNTGVYGISNQGNGTVGVSTSGFGVYGQSGSNIAVYGVSSSNIGLYGLSTSSHGLYASTSASGARAVFGMNSGGGPGVWGETSGAGVGVQGVNTNSSGWAGYFTGNLGVTGIPKANQTTFTIFSDARLKKNVKPLEGALGQLLQLRGKTFEWKNPAEHGDQQGTQVGFIAQDVERVLPAWVTTNSDGVKMVTTRGLEAMLVESLRTLKNENDQLRSRLDKLEGRQSPVRAETGFGNLSFIALGAAGMFLGARRLKRTRPELRQGDDGAPPTA